MIEDVRAEDLPQSLDTMPSFNFSVLFCFVFKLCI